MLDFASFAVLRVEPLPANEALRLIADLTETDLAGSAVARTAMIMLRRAVDAGGLKLTATGNLSRATVAEMIEITEWPADQSGPEAAGLGAIWRSSCFAVSRHLLALQPGLFGPKPD
jgi:hypothetical protein